MQFNTVVQILPGVLIEVLFLQFLSARHQDFLAVHRFWYILCSCDEPFATRSMIELQFHPTPGSKRFITTA